eukprot:scaffold170884_cov21-Tisochrysis_lutea.AAC.2
MCLSTCIVGQQREGGKAANPVTPAVSTAPCVRYLHACSHAQVDSKKELEKRLKAVCESFIMAATKVAVDPMLSFLTKVTAVRVAAQANPAAARPLRDQ